MAETRVVWSPELLGYDFGDEHPMAPLRLDLTVRLVEALGLLDGPGTEVVPAPVASDEVLLTAHDAEYVAAVRRASDDGLADLAHGLGTDDDPVFPGMHEAAARIVGGSHEAAGELAAGRCRHAVNIAGGMHHAMPDRAAGFCVYNDAVVAIRRLLADGVERVAYVDLDAHHGDGVERAFWDDPRVLTVSLHESGHSLFPGTGHVADVGGPAAQGCAVNVPLPAGTTDGAWLRAVDAVVVPLLRAFRPGVVVSQHGCDAHGLDPLTNLSVSVDAQRAAVLTVHDLVHEVCDGRWLALGGGGYAVAQVVPRAWAHLVAVAVHAPLDPETAVPQAWREHVHEVFGFPAPVVLSDGRPVRPHPWDAGHDPDDDVDRVLLAVRQAVFPAHGLDVSLG